MLKDLVRHVAYWSGTLGMVHRWRNRQTLTVLMFHRVLPADSQAYASAEREFTLSVDNFGKCLDFVQRHFQVVTHASVKSHFDHGAPLPECAALITFDDGWRDNLVHALPELKKRGLPSVLFLATSVLDSQEDRWWQDQLVEVLTQSDGLAWLESTLSIQTLANDNRDTRIKRVTAKVGLMGASNRLALLRQRCSEHAMPRQMLLRADLKALTAQMAVAGHGHSHVPLAFHTNANEDLDACSACLKQIGGDYWALSFPHGSFEPSVVGQARDAGFSVCYSSESTLTSTARSSATRSLIGRIHIPENRWTCGSNGISAAKLATFLFFRQIAS